MIGFTLTDKQKQLRDDYASLFKTLLQDAYGTYAHHSDQQTRFRATRPYYIKMIEAGILKAFLPADVGGTCESWLDLALIIEEGQAIDPSCMIHALGTALGLLPLVLGGTDEQKKRFLKPFLSGKGEHLASLTHSEPGGTANHLQKGGKGLGVTARKEGNYYVVNGEKLWTTNSGGWDSKGATLSCLVVRYSETGGPEDPNVDPASNVMILAVTREIIAANPPNAYQVLSEPDLMGMTAVTGPHTRYVNFKVPADHLLFDRGVAAPIIEKAFGVTAALVSAQAVATARVAFDLALKFAKTDTRGGSVPIIQHQSVADLLIKTKLRIDTARLMVWKALDSLENGPGDEKAVFESCLEAKIYGTDMCLPAVYDCMQAVGITSYANKSQFPRLLNDAAVYALFDGGNVGIRRRQMQKLMCGDDYKPWANL